MALKPKKKSLADKINALITAKPQNFDSDDEVDETKAKVVEHCEDSDNSEDNLSQSLIRRRNVDTLDQLDQRYAGKKISRKDLQSDEDGGESNEENSENEASEMEDEEMNSENENEVASDIEEDDEEEEEEEEEESDEEKKNSEDDEEEDQESENDENSEEKSDSDNEDEDYGFDIGNPLLRDRRPESKIKTMSDTNLRADIEKGNCVRTQLKLWENLLEMRIKMQKCLVTSNQMPQHNHHKILRSDAEFAKKTNETKHKLSSLLDNLLHLQNRLLKQYPETKNLDAKKRKRKANDTGDEEEDNKEDSMDEEIPSDTEDEQENEKEETEENSEEENSEEDTNESKETIPRKKRRIADYEQILAENHRMYLDYRNSVIQKWNEKTRIASGSIGKGMSQTTLKQIEFALSDKQKLRKRTQLKRSEYPIVCKPEAIDENESSGRGQEYDSEIFDDDDFYHQLLRDLIEYKSSDVTDPIQLSKQWIQLQNLRSKMKRKIDTRATKGRKIRYNVHNKLVNFMAPITVNDTWTDNAKNELYNSLFGKIKPANGEGIR